MTINNMNNKNIFYVALAALLGLYSCTDKYQYEPAAPQEDKVYVTIDKNTVRSLEVDGSDIELTLLRNTTNGSTTVSLGIEDKSGLFSLAENSVTFADGEETAVAKVIYDYDKLSMSNTYNVCVSITDASLVSEYVVSSMPLSCIKAWKKLGKAQFYEGWFFGEVWEKDLIQSPDGSQTYRILLPFTQEDIESAGLFTFSSETPYIEFSIADDGSVSYANYIELGFSYQSMLCYFAAPYWLREDEAGQAYNKLIMDGLVQFYWYPILGNTFTTSGSYSWWGEASVAYLSLPGGPDLNELLQ